MSIRRLHVSYETKFKIQQAKTATEKPASTRWSCLLCCRTPSCCRPGTSVSGIVASSFALFHQQQNSVFFHQQQNSMFYLNSKEPCAWAAQTRDGRLQSLPPQEPGKKTKIISVFLSPSGDLGISLVWHNLSPPHRTATFRFECWNPLLTELNHLWGVLSCSQDDIRWF